MDKFPTIKQSPNPVASYIECSRQQLERDNLVHLDMRISPPEQESLDRIHIEQEVAPFNSYGPVTEGLVPRLAEYLSAMGRNDRADIEHVAAIIYRLASGVQTGFRKDASWVTVRISLPTSAFDIPRWHPDGGYFRTEVKTYKLVATLRGDQTLFGKVADQEAYRQLEEAERENRTRNQDDPDALEAEDMRIRKELAHIIEPINAPHTGEATVYLVGDEDAVIHSEPPIREPRIFVSVLPGSREQIGEWRARSE